MSTLPLPTIDPSPVRPVRCRRCHRVCRHGTTAGLGPECAVIEGIVPARRCRFSVVSGPADQPLFEINEGEIMIDINLTDVLDLNIGPNDSNSDTVRGYLTELLLMVWRDGECFDGKRPFGNSSWEYELYTPLVKAGYVTGVLDEDGYLDTFDREAADHLIGDAIKTLGGVQ